MDPKELRELLTKQLEEMKTLEAALDAVSEEDAENRPLAQKAFDTKKDEFNATKKKLEAAILSAKEEQAATDLIAQAKALEETRVPAGALTAPATTSVEATAIDHAQKQVDQLYFVQRFLTAKKGVSALNQQEYDAIKVKNPTFKAGNVGVTLPLFMRIKMLGLPWANAMGFSATEIDSARKASVMVSATNALGGYTVPEDFRPTMIQLPVEEAHVLPRATVLPSDTGEITIPRARQTDSDEYGGMAGEWISEAGAKPQSDTRFEQVTIQCHEYAMYTQVSIRLLERSAIAMENWITTRGRQKCMDAMDTAFIRGSGTGQPTGFLNTAGIRSVARQTAGAVDHTDLVNLKYALKPYHRAGGTFMVDDEVMQSLEISQDTLGRPLFAPSVANGPYNRLVGYPYVANTRQPNLGSEGDTCFIDLREYYVGMEQDVVVKRSDDYDIVHNVATIVIFMVIGGELVEPRVCAELSANIS